MSQRSGLAQILMILPDGLDWSGRSGRLAFFVSASMVVGAMLAIGATQVFSTANSIAFLALAVSYLMFLGHMRRRLRDLALSGWFMWILVVPIINLFFILYLVSVGSKAKADVSADFSRIGFAFACCLAGLFLMRLFWAPYWIPAGSMKPTLLVGDYLAVVRVGTPQRGDVLVFRNPTTGSEYIKRLIGMPGETVQMRDSVLYINGAAIASRDDGTFDEVMQRQGGFGGMPRCANGPVGMGQVCHKDRMVQTLPNGVRHAVLNIARTSMDDTGVFSVPQGHYFFLGDNRDNSADSRMPTQVGGLGFVPHEALVGRASRIIVSSAGRSMLHVWTWRADRFFRSVM